MFVSAAEAAGQKPDGKLLLAETATAVGCNSVAEPNLITAAPKVAPFQVLAAVG